MKSFRWCLLFVSSSLFVCTGAASGEPDSTWTFRSARAEIEPLHVLRRHVQVDSSPTLTIQADEREGLAGHWRRTFGVEGNQWYRIDVSRQVDRIEHPRRVAVARLIWLDEQGRNVLRSEPTFSSYRPGERPRAEPEFIPVVDRENAVDRLSGTYQAPPAATQVVLELHFRWGPAKSSVRWSDVSLTKSEAPESRLVRLAAIHYQPRGGETSMDKCEQFAPLIEKASEKGADLIVLPETLTYYGSGGTYADAAEMIPGPSTDYFGALAKKHSTYIVAGLLERDEHLIYNVAVLLGPDGNVKGKYRKVCLPRGEIEGGLTPGNDYPVFDTRFGKLGMMVCYDGFFPEVARELSNRGAEVIAWPVWGCNPLLASARACENHVYVVSSTYTDRSRDWMLTAVFGHDGEPLSVADDWGSIAFAEVDLSRPTYWHSLGDFRAQLPAHRPIVSVESAHSEESAQEAR